MLTSGFISHLLTAIHFAVAELIDETAVCESQAIMLTRILAQSATQLAGLSTFSQIIFCLPLALDFLGPPSFLLLSLLLILHSFIYSTLRLLLKNTPFASLIGLLNVLNPMVPSVTALIVLWLYLNPPTTGDSAYSMKRIMMESLPGIYAASLRIVSPIFSILEGFATLLVRVTVGKCWTLIPKMLNGDFPTGMSSRG